MHHKSEVKMYLFYLYILRINWIEMMRSKFSLQKHLDPTCFIYDILFYQVCNNMLVKFPGSLYLRLSDSIEKQCDGTHGATNPITIDRIENARP